ncbi:BTAD domain-containing putative transcriptional regulator [Pseudofrankia asymbiotica]|uniref:BTAD domain-containing putative transcriptional regulator n=1 Tax=Pseudofrankia asymbiotica TaxID=1834516 RepID=UPI000BBA01CB|nr:BTAD domain-containing putative transcriptional regulator [Pseudofrankia asymbiotica]
MRIRLLGAFAVEIDGRDVAAHPWRLRKSRTLVKVLALAPDQRAHRDQLLDLLWPDLRAAAAANNLHQALHVARRELIDARRDEAVLVIRDGVVLLHGDRAVETDVDRFGQLATRAWATRQVADLAAAIDGYTGELLPEDRFDDWARVPREDLRQAFCDLLVAHAAAAVRGGQAEVAWESLRRAVEADPAHEPAVRGFDLPVGKATASHHFAVLRAAGLLEQVDQGSRRLNRLRRAEFDTRFPGLLTLVLAEQTPPADGR